MLQTRTLVVDRPSDESAPTLSEMLADLHKSYRLKDDDALSDPFDALVAAAGDRAPDERKAERVLHYGERLQRIVDAAGGAIENGAVTVDETKVTPEAAATITRAWELALDPVDLTTNVFLDDGDVVTRFACRDGVPAEAVVAFHGEMTTVGLGCWQELIRLVSHLLTSLMQLLRPRGLVAAVRLWRLRMPAELPAAAAGPREPAVKRARELVGTGGKLFVTDAPDGSGGGIRTLVQIDGDIVTRATADSIRDPALLREHCLKIEAWFAKLNRDSTRLQTGFDAATIGGTLALVGVNATTITEVSVLSVAQVGLLLVPGALRHGLRVGVRRWILTATKATAPRELPA